MSVKYLHIVPVEDSITHTYGVTCACKPKLIVSQGSQIVVHHADDHREELEDLGLTTERGWLTVALK